MQPVNSTLRYSFPSLGPAFNTRSTTVKLSDLTDCLQDSATAIPVPDKGKGKDIPQPI